MKIHNEIEKKRIEMYQLAKSKGLRNKKTIQISKELDYLLNNLGKHKPEKEL